MRLLAKRVALGVILTLLWLLTIHLHLYGDKTMLKASGEDESTKLPPSHTLIQTDTQSLNQATQVITVAASSHVNKVNKNGRNQLTLKPKRMKKRLAVDTDAKSLAIFAGSLREVSKNIDAVIFVNRPVPGRHLEIASKYNITLRTFDPTKSFSKQFQNFHPSSQRYLLYEQFFRKNNGSMQHQYQKVVLADVRDTAFQSDPFAIIPNGNRSFITVAENNGITIGKCGWNSAWVKDCFGNTVLNELYMRRVVCSGISLATIDKAVEYVRLMASILRGQPSYAGKFPACERNGVDQGIHNVMVYKNLMPDITVKDETNFLVSHLQSTTLDESKSDYVVNSKGVKYAIVHQYDRWHDFQVQLAVKHVYWVDCRNETQTWTQEEQCAKYKYLSGSDFFAGMCDIGHFRALTASSCCTACDRKVFKETSTDIERQCNAFAYVNGVCFLKGCLPKEREKWAAFTNNKDHLMTRRSDILPSNTMSAFVYDSFVSG